MKPLLIVISAPSGAGKTTLCDLLLRAYPEIEYSVSCTTRLPRPGEEDGEDYHFIPEEQFARLVKEGRFLEYATVHGHSYGTLREPIADALKQGQSVLLDIDVQGASKVRACVARLPADDLLRRGYVDIFINPPSIDELRVRLENRGTDSPETIEKRLKNAEEELAHSGEYMYQLTNDDLRTCFKRLCDVVNVKGGLV